MKEEAAASRQLRDSYNDDHGSCKECKEPLACTADEVGPCHAGGCSYWKALERRR